jgi:methionyl-tRNA formyltransferase
LVSGVYRLTVRAVILTNPQGNQIALVNKLIPHIEIAAVIFSKNIPRRKPTTTARAKTLANRIAGRLTTTEFRDTWNQMLAVYSELYPTIPVEHSVYVENINEEATLAAINQYSPDLVLVSGTNIVGSRVIDAAHRSGKIMNLHTGISPYVKGGPNCTNWCLAKGWFHLIGNTTMWIDKGIDTGNIIATERTPLDGGESLFDLHWKVMEHAHDLYLRSVRRFAAGSLLPDISQASIAKGELFSTSQWTSSAMKSALGNFKRDFVEYFSESMSDASADVKLFPLEDD